MKHWHIDWHNDSLCLKFEQNRGETYTFPSKTVQNVTKMTLFTTNQEMMIQKLPFYLGTCEEKVHYVTKTIRKLQFYLETCATRYKGALTLVTRPHFFHTRPHDSATRPLFFFTRPHDFATRPLFFTTRPHFFCKRPHIFTKRPQRIMKRPQNYEERPQNVEKGHKTGTKTWKKRNISHISRKMGYFSMQKLLFYLESCEKMMQKP